MTYDECFEYIVKNIHTVILSTVNEKGYPITCAIDVMDFDKQGLYFLTAKGKSLYTRLKGNEHIAFTAVKGNSTLSSIAISIQGNVKEIGNDKLSDLFLKNRYMNEIYPTKQSREALTVFQIYAGNGEWFDLSKKPIERFGFSFGQIQEKRQGYFVTDKCIHCKLCYSKCPQKCIDYSTTPVVIQQNHCLHCGNCYTICPVRAIEKKGDAHDAGRKIE